MTERVINFAPGPAILPEPVLEQLRDEMLELPGLGMSVMEISHRSKQFADILATTQANLRTLLDIPDDYQILFLQGGSRLQFAMIPMNFGSEGQFIVTGTWGKNAYTEAGIFGPTSLAWDGSQDQFTRIPADDELQLDEQAPFIHFTSNETIQGVQFPTEPEVGSLPLVCDASSDFLSRPLPMKKYGMLYACAQKNAGPAGVTIAIIRDDLIERSQGGMPSYLNYRIQAEKNSLYNTAPTFPIYVVKLVTDWLLNEIGGLEKMQARNQHKATLLYDVIDAHPDFYRLHAQPDSRSLMNVSFRLPSEDLEQQFLAGAAEKRLMNLKGHRSVGGIRASIYNAMPVHGVEQLRDYMLSFRESHSS